MHIVCFKKCVLWKRRGKRQALETMSPYSLLVSTSSLKKAQALTTWNSALQDQTKRLSYPWSNIPVGRLLLQPNKRVYSYFQDPVRATGTQILAHWPSCLQGNPGSTSHIPTHAQRESSSAAHSALPSGCPAPMASPGLLLVKPCTPVGAIQTASMARGCPSVSPRMATKLHHTSSFPSQVQVAHEGLVCGSALRCIKHL